MKNLPEIPTDWTEPEKWVWKQIIDGKIANLYEYDADNVHRKPNNEKGWGKDCRLRSKFLQTILTQKIFYETIPFSGVRILGALIDDTPLNLKHARLQHLLWLENSKILVEVQCSKIRVDGGLSFEKSFIAKNIKLNGAHILESISLKKAIIEGPLDLNGVKVNGSAFLDSGSIFKSELDLISINIAGHLEMDGSIFEKNVKLNSARVGGYAILHAESIFKSELDLTSIKIGSSLHLAGSTFEGDVNLTESTINGAFMLTSSKNGSASWKEGASLKLRNTHVGTLQDWWQDKTANSWPGNYQLEGFTYNRLGVSSKDQKADMLARPANSFIEWLEGDPTCSPQPYEHLAERFQKAGKLHKASDILYAERERQLRKAWSAENGDRDWGRAFTLSLMKITIGYGLGNRYFWSLRWVGGLTVFGTLVVLLFGSHCLASFPEIAFASLDQLLPIVTLDKAHDIFIFGDPTGKSAMLGQPDGVKFYFYFHKLLGWVLGSFLIAGLSGLTQKN